jgi:hypothetical protein
LLFVFFVLFGCGFVVGITSLVGFWVLFSCWFVFWVVLGFGCGFVFCGCARGCCGWVVVVLVFFGVCFAETLLFLDSVFFNRFEANIWSLGFRQKIQFSIASSTAFITTLTKAQNRNFW